MKNTGFVKGMGIGLAVGSAIGMAVVMPKNKPMKCKVSKALRTVGDVIENVGDIMGF